MSACVPRDAGGVASVLLRPSRLSYGEGFLTPKYESFSSDFAGNLDLTSHFSRRERVRRFELPPNKRIFVVSALVEMPTFLDPVFVDQS